MAAKKKSGKKKAAKKKASSKPKKAAKKKAAKRTKKAAKTKKSRKAKTISVKKVAGKKKALKRGKPIGIAPKGPSIAPVDLQSPPLTIVVEFSLGQGEAEVRHKRGVKTLETKSFQVSGAETFQDVRKFDRISIDGTCTGSVKITTDRITNPPSDEQNPRRFPEGVFLDGLSVES